MYTAKSSCSSTAEMYGGIDRPTKAPVDAAESNLEYWRIAATVPMKRPTLMPIVVAKMPRTSVLASAFLSSGHTGRLPLIERPQSPVTK